MKRSKPMMIVRYSEAVKSSEAVKCSEAVKRRGRRGREEAAGVLIL
jgi:hypothetical protein